MPRLCAVCVHAKKREIDKALIGGDSCRAISALFSVSIHSVTRHKARHLPKTMQKAKGAREVTHADDLLAQVRALQRKAVALLLKAETEGDLKTALSGIREARSCLELLAKLQGDINDAPQVNIIVNPQWLELRAVIVQSLEGYPDARLAVAEALESMEPRNAF